MERVAVTHGRDACAVIAYLCQEPGAEVLKALIERPTTFLAMYVCNLGEGYSDFFRADGLTTAETAWTNTLTLPLVLRRDADDAFIQRVGVIKVEEGISFANAFALALAERLNFRWSPPTTTNVMPSSGRDTFDVCGYASSCGSQPVRGVSGRPTSTPGGRSGTIRLW